LVHNTVIIITITIIGKVPTLWMGPLHYLTTSLRLPMERSGGKGRGAYVSKAHELKRRSHGPPPCNKEAPEG